MSDDKRSFDIIAWFAQNHVASNLLMIALLAGGLGVMSIVRQEVEPSFIENEVDIVVTYPGASPEEVETGLVLAIESEMRSLPFAERVTAFARESRAQVSVDLIDGIDREQALSDIREAVNRIRSFPEDAERPEVSLDVESRRVMTVAVAADLPERALFELMSRVRNDLLTLPGVARVETRGVRAPEVRIEVPQATLRSYGLTLADLARTIDSSAKDVPAGGVRTRSGEVLLRTTGRREWADEFKNIPMVTGADGSVVTLEDIAVVRESFEEEDVFHSFDGLPGVRLFIYQSTKQSPLGLSRELRAYFDEVSAGLPDTARLIIVEDEALEYGERLDTIITNGTLGLLLVLIALGLFLRPRIAFWVAVAIPVTLIGAFIAFPIFDGSINMVTLFAFIMTLGIVVDDAVIVGENVYRRIQDGDPPTEAVVKGTKEMAVPVIFAVVTNIIAFIPLMVVPGDSGRMLQTLPMVVVAVFVVSLVEALLILPSHLLIGRKDTDAAATKSSAGLEKLRNVQSRVSAKLEHFRNGPFTRFVETSIDHRYVTLMAFVCVLVVLWGWFASGRLEFSFDPVIEGNRVDAEAELYQDAAFEDSLNVALRIEAAGLRAAEAFGGADEVLTARFIRVGTPLQNAADINLTLVPESERDFTAAEFTARWREEVGEMAALETLFFEYQVGFGGGRLRVMLSHPDIETLENAASELAGILGTFDGLEDINDGFATGKQQLSFTLTPEAKALGLTEESLGRQVRAAIYGVEAFRQLRGANEIKVMISLPEDERRSIASLESLIVRTPSGVEIPFTEAATVAPGRAYTMIRRENGRRNLMVSAYIEPSKTSMGLVRSELESSVLPDLMAKYPGMDWSYSGRQEERDLASRTIIYGLGICLFAIFALLASLFRSYIQALVVMASIPFSVGAAVFGHILLGFDMSIVSIFGMIALCGLVVNGALVLTVRMNDRLRQGVPLEKAVVEAARYRFRPILLTSLTTCIGLMPMLFETSAQATYLVPMAIGLTFGILMSTVVVLILTPVLHIILGAAKIVAATSEKIPSPSQNIVS